MNGTALWRWLILISVTAVWLFCMRLIHLNFRPQDVSQAALPGTQAALDALFSENAELRRKWRIYIDLEKLSGSPAARKQVWDGVDERNLCDIGYLNTRLNRKHITRLEQLSDATLDLPLQSAAPEVTQFSRVRFESRANISLDQGVEDFKTELTAGTLKATAVGFREGEALRVREQVFQNDKPILNQPRILPVGPKAAPTLELLPFQNNPEIKKGYKWPLVTFDSGSLLSGANSTALHTVEAACTGTREIVYEGRRMTVFEASTADGKARAWYSADGNVLKQAYNLAGLLDVMVVRADLFKHDGRP